MNTIIDNDARRNFLDTIGWISCCTALGVGDPALNQGIRRGFPASWFDTLDRLGAEKGIEVPRELFNWKARTQEPAQ